MSGHAELIAELERQARRRSHNLESLAKLPTGFTERHYPLTRSEQTELNLLKHAGAAAGDADTFVALCKGRPVHPSRLNPEHVAYLQMLRARERMDGRDRNE